MHLYGPLVSIQLKNSIEHFRLDARFHKGLIENCESDIQKYCQSSFVHDPVEDENEDDEREQGKNDLSINRSDSWFLLPISQYV